MAASAAPSRGVRIVGCVVLILLTFGFAALSAMPSSDGPWYDSLEKAPWNPPPAAFGIVWPILYVLMAVAACLVWWKEGPKAGLALGLYGGSLLLNAAFSWVFFAWHSIWGGLACVAAYLVLLLPIIWLFKRSSKLAAWLLVPLLLWLAYALSLSGYIAFAN